MPFIIQYKREYTHHKEYRWIGTQNRTECQSGIGSRVVEMRGGMKQNHFIAFVSSAAHKRRTALRKQHQQDNIFRIVVLQCLCARAADEWIFTAHTHTANEPTNYTRNKGIARIRYELSHLALDILKCRLCVCAWVCFLCRSSQQNAFQKVMINCIEAETIVICLSLISCYANCSLCDGYMVWMTTPSRHNVITP